MTKSSPFTGVVQPSIHTFRTLGLKAVQRAHSDHGMNGRIKTWLVIALAAALIGPLAGCASYVGVDPGYAEPPPDYDDGWYPDADIGLYGGGYYGGGDVYDYSRRGHESRGGGDWGHGGGGVGAGHGGGHVGGGGGGGGHGGGHGR